MARAVRSLTAQAARPLRRMFARSAPALLSSSRLWASKEISFRKNLDVAELANDFVRVLSIL